MNRPDSDHLDRLRLLYGTPDPTQPDEETLRRQMQGVGDPLARRCEAVGNVPTTTALASLVRDYDGAAQIAMKLRAALFGDAQNDA